VKEKAQEKGKELRKVEEEEVVYMAKPREAQQGMWKRSLMAELRKKAEEHCGKEVPEKALLLELG